MELAKGGELFDKLLEFGSLQEPVAAKLMYQVNTFLSNKFNIFLFLNFNLDSRSSEVFA